MKTNYDLISELMITLSKPEQRRLNQQLIKLNTQNKELRKATHDGFVFNGQFYVPSDINRIIAVKGKSYLDVSLIPQMELYLKDRDQVIHDIQRIQQILDKLLRPADDMQGKRDALPECFVDLLERIRTLPRMQNEAWTIVNNPRAYREYNTLLPKMQSYAMGRLMY